MAGNIWSDEEIKEFAEEDNGLESFAEKVKSGEYDRIREGIDHIPPYKEHWMYPYAKEKGLLD